MVCMCVARWKDVRPRAVPHRIQSLLWVRSACVDGITTDETLRAWFVSQLGEIRFSFCFQTQMVRK